jgi:hypothetical protein
MLLSSAVMASAQDQVRATAPAPIVDVVNHQKAMVDSLNSLALLNKKLEVRVSPEEVVARLMSFDRNGDGKVATSELSERMQGLVARADRSADGALDAAEIRSFSESPQSFQTAFRNLQGGGYGFGDTGGLSTRTHIENTIEDLRLAPQVNQEAKRIGASFADELEGTALANLKRVVAPMLTEPQLAEFERNLTSVRNRVITMSSNGTRTTQTFAIGADAAMMLARYPLTPEQRKTAIVAGETFKAEQQLDDARRSALVAQVSGILTDEESDNFRAALARRPLVKGLGAFEFQATIREEAVRVPFPGNGAPVREIGFTAVPAVLTSR